MDVIIVDDEPAARRTVRECCEREADLKVVGEYGDSRTALEAIRREPPQVLFLVPGPLGHIARRAGVGTFGRRPAPSPRRRSPDRVTRGGR